MTLADTASPPLRRGALLATTIATIAFATAAAAQTPPATVGDHYVPAPWWMRDPVTASLGWVRAEVPANRASFSATFQVIDKSGPEAMVQASEKVRELGKGLVALGADKVEVRTTFQMQPLYEQYRDKDGNLQTNARPDKIERYAVEAQLSVTIRDVALLEKTYAAVLAAKPTTTSPVGFSLEPTNELKAWLFQEAVKDAARRGHAAAEAAGAKLGAVKIIDPTARVCRTDVLAGWPSYGGGNAAGPTTVDAGYYGAPPPPPPPSSRVNEVVVTGQRRRGDAIRPEDIQLPLQAPLEQMTAEACVVYGLT